MMPTIRFPKLYPKQHAAFYAPERIAMIEASTKSGKTAGAMTWLSMYGVNDAPGCALLWVSYIYPQAKVVWTRLVRQFSKMDPTHETGWDTNATDLWFQLPGGGRIWFKGGDNPDAIYGADYAAAIIDEASRCREEVWPAVRSTLTATRGPVRIIGNVKGRKNWAYKMARRAQSGEPDYSYSRITGYDAAEAGVLEKQEIEDARRDLPENVWRELYLAEASDDVANPFGMDAIKACIAGMSGAEPVAFGIDLAKHVDYTVVVGLDQSGGVCRLERWQGDWQQTERRILDIVGDVPAFADSTGVGDAVVEGLQREAPNIEGYTFTSRSKQQLMEGLAVAIQQGEVFYPDGWLVAELESFEYEYTRTGVKYSAPQGMHDDGVCALALATRKLTGIARHTYDVAWVGADDELEAVEAGWR